MVQTSPGVWMVYVYGNQGEEVKRFGPYYSREAAERCEENYKAFVMNAPVCNH